MRYYGKFAIVELREQRVDFREVPEEDLKLFFGGGGIGAKLLFDSGDDDAIVMANGLLTGFPITTACKTSFLFRSPQTGVIGESSVGGKFGAQLKRAGLDGLIIHGVSTQPVTLFIHDATVEFRDAGAVWGLDTFAAEKALTAQLPDGSIIGVIGPGGENRVGYASLMFEGEFPRAAGRTGIGAKFGEKKIKGIAVNGSQKPEPHDRAALAAYTKELNKQIRERTAGLHNFGTAGAVARREKSGDLPIKNFAQGEWEGAEKISGQVFAKEMVLHHHGCYMCPIACAKKIRLQSGPYAGLETTQPEYETAGALGSNLLNESPEDLAVANMLCNKLGVDTISAGVAISWLFECYEKGLVTRERIGLGDLEPTWGNGPAIHALIEKIARREGIGDLLADGVRRAAEKIGRGSDHFAVHAKGLELPMHDPRALVSAGATYATGNRGGSHNEAPAYYIEEGMKIEGFPQGVDPHTPSGKGSITARMQDLSTVFDALGLCKFTLSGGISSPQLSRFVELTMGWEMPADELMAVGDRIYTLKRLYIQRLGVNHKDDTLPGRILRDKRGAGFSGESLPDLTTMLRELYAARGWDNQGCVTKEKAEAMGLSNYYELGGCS